MCTVNATKALSSASHLCLSSLFFSSLFISIVVFVVCITHPLCFIHRSCSEIVFLSLDSDASPLWSSCESELFSSSISCALRKKKKRTGKKKRRRRERGKTGKGEEGKGKETARKRRHLICSIEKVARYFYLFRTCCVQYLCIFTNARSTATKARRSMGGGEASCVCVKRYL